MLIGGPFKIDGKPPLGTYGGGSLAELAEVRRTFVGLIENGYSSPTLATIVRFANALNVDPGQLLAGIAGDGAQNSNNGRQ